MLVLSRRCQESVVVGGEIGGEFEFKVTVVAVKAGKVRLGFDVDPKVPVHRSEVWERMRSGGGQPERPSSPKRLGHAEDTRPVQKSAAFARKGAA